MNKLPRLSVPLRLWRYGLFILSLVFLASCAPRPAVTPAPPVSGLRVVMDNNYPPYVFIGEDGGLEGLLVDQWKLWEQYTGVKVEIVALPWGEALEGMEAGQFDVIDTIFYTDERAKIFDFTPPYADINVRIFFRDKISGLVTGEDLRGFRVAVKTGDADVDYLLARGVKDMVYYEGYEDIVRAAVTSQETVFVIDEPPAFYFLYKYGMESQFKYSAPLYSGQFHRAVKKGNAALLNLVEDGFALVSKAEYQAINDRWFGTKSVGSLDTWLPYLALAAASSVLLILLLFIFNRTLRQRVQERTQELEAALTSLQKSEMRFQRAMEAANDGLWDWDLTTNEIYYSPGYLRMLGYDPEHGQGEYKDWTRSIHPDDFVQAMAANEACIRNETQSFAVEFRMRTRTGGWRWILGRGSAPRRDANGRALQMVGTHVDITDRKHTEEILRENEERLRTITENAPDVILQVNREGVIQFINQTVPGLERERVIGSKIYQWVSKEEYPTLERALEAVFETGQRQEYESTGPGPHGETRNYHVRVMPVIIAGTASTAIYSASDITELQKTLNSLRQSEERYRVLVETLNTGIFTSTLDGKFLQANSTVAEMAGYASLEEFMHLPAQNMYADPEDRQKLIAELQSQGFVRNVEIRSVKKDGTQFWISMSAVVLKDNDGQPAAILGSLIDITERKLAQETIHRSEARFRALIEKSAEALTLLGPDGTVIYEGPTVQRLTGYSADDRVGKNALGKIFPDDLPIVRQTLGEVLAHPGHSVTAVFRSIRKDSSVWWTEGTATNLLHDPSVQAIVVNYRDITERKQAEAALAESRDQLQLVLESTFDGYYDWNKQTGQSYFSPRYYLMLGYEPGEFTPSHAAWASRVHPDDLPEAERKLTAHSEGRTLQFTAEFRMQTKAGDWRWILSRGKVVKRDKKGNILRLVGTHTDITDRKLAEENLRNSENRFRVLFEHAGVGVAQVDSHTGRFLQINQKYCDIIGYTRAEMLEKDFQTITHPDDLPKDLVNMERVRKGEVSESMLEKRYIRKDGTLVWVLVIVSPLWAPGESPSTHITVVHDITEQKRTEYALRYSEAQVRELNAVLEQRVKERTAQLEVANKELEAFAYSVSHDLRAPLRAIDGFSRILMEDHASQMNAEMLALLERVRTANQNMNQLVEALLGLSRMTRAQMHREEIDLGQLAHGIADNLRQINPERAVEFVIPENVPANGDLRLLKVVLENLLGNAWKFTSRREAARIEFGVERRDDETAYFVRDNGAGFNMAYATKLFGAFQRLHSSAQFEGTGIGLATVQRIVTRHGGRIWAEAEDGVGATFYFTLG